MILRELFVKLGLDIDEASFAKGHLAAELVKTGLEKIVEIAAETVSAFVENTHAVIEYGDKVIKTSQAIGIATDALQELQYAGSLADLSAEDMSQSIGILSRKMLEAKQGSEEAGKAFKGIAFKDGSKLIATDEVLGNIADKFQQMPDGAEKTAMAMQLFGRAGKQMIPLLNKGREELEATREEARSLGLVLSEDTAKGAEELNDNLHRLHAVTQGLWRQAIAPIIPALSHLVKRFLEWRKENAKILSQRLERFVGLLVKGVESLGDVMSFLVKNATALKIVLGAGGLFLVVNSLATAMNGLSIASVRAAIATARAWLVAAAPFIAIGALIAGFLLVFDDIRVYLGGGKSLYGRFKGEIDSWTKKKTDIWFVDALKDFIRYIQEAIEWLKDLDDVFGDGSKSRALADKRAAKNKGQIQQDADRQTLQTARQRAGQGLPLTKAEQDAINRTGGNVPAFANKYTPTATGPDDKSKWQVDPDAIHRAGGVPELASKNTSTAMVPEARAPAAGANGGATVNAPANFNFTFPPGTTPKDVGPFKQALDEWWNGVLSPAVAQGNR